MNWYLKSAGFKLLSLLPGGGSLYHLTQERLTRSTVANRQRVNQKLEVGLGYWRWLKVQGDRDILREKLLDLGAGWHPTIPLLWHAFGAEEQVLVDVYPNLNVQRLLDTARLFREVAGDPQWPERAELRRLPEFTPANGADFGALLKRLHFRYHAPYTGVLAGEPDSFGAVFCTQVLQHVSRPAQLAIYREIHHCLRPGGLFLATVHLVGHFSSPHLQRGQYTHLRFSPGFWERIVNSSLMSFNRLKAPDYREMLEQTGFRLRAFEVQPPSPADLAELKRTRVHPAFRHYPEHELAARHLFFVAEKP